MLCWICLVIQTDWNQISNLIRSFHETQFLSIFRSTQYFSACSNVFFFFQLEGMVGSYHRREEENESLWWGESHQYAWPWREDQKFWFEWGRRLLQRTWVALALLTPLRWFNSNFNKIRWNSKTVHVEQRTTLSSCNFCRTFSSNGFSNPARGLHEFVGSDIYLEKLCMNLQALPSSF